jgi:hypothetical protein
MLSSRRDDNGWSVAMHYIALTAAVLICAVPATGFAAEVFLICKGSISIERHGGGSRDLQDVEESIKIDTEKRTFSSSWYGNFKSCYEEEQNKNLPPELISCSSVATSDVQYEFEIRSPGSYTRGSIDRVSGHLYAKTEVWQYSSKKDSIPPVDEWKTRIMTCAPAARQF